jgi:hypothetical protein
MSMKRRKLFASASSAVVAAALPALGDDAEYMVTRYYEEFDDGIKLACVFVCSNGEVIKLTPDGEPAYFVIGPNGGLAPLSSIP